MTDQYFAVNIRAYLTKEELTYIGEEHFNDLLSDFSCPKNPDVEYFLSHNAIEFTKKAIFQFTFKHFRNCHFFSSKYLRASSPF